MSRKENAQNTLRNKQRLTNKRLHSEIFLKNATEGLVCPVPVRPRVSCVCFHKCTSCFKYT